MRKNLFPVLVAVFLFLSSCSNSAALYSKEYPLMGTTVIIKSKNPEAISIAASIIPELEAKWSVYIDSSEVSKINKYAGVKPVRVSRDTIHLLELSYQVYDITQGRFDVSIGRLIELWGPFLREEKNDFPAQEKIQYILKNSGMDKIVVNNEAQTVFLKNRIVQINLGGIAKGYIVDKVVQAFKNKGVESALINAGGDIYCLGVKKGVEFWQVGIQSPDILEGIMSTLELENEAIATSGNYERYFMHNGKIYGHIINPITGYPTEGDRESVTVVANNCTTADSLATGFFVWGQTHVGNYLASNKNTLKVFWVKAAGKKTSIHYLQ